MDLRISPGVREKLETKHRVTVGEVEQCFANREGGFLEDLRERHRTQPPTRWFIARTNDGRALKVVFILRGSAVHLRTAFEPEEGALRLYELHGR